YGVHAEGANGVGTLTTTRHRCLLTARLGWQKARILAHLHECYKEMIAVTIAKQVRGCWQSGLRDEPEFARNAG
ncbi:hypothetical protein, partial [Pseudomonas putida]|uniref:hypothetical protein n=1 Tax=Pseudomonas putida TaxID=303 RepID=UPI003905DE85